MKISTPVITLIVGVALAASLLFSDMTAVSTKKADLAAAAASASAAAAASAAATASAAASPADAQSSSATASPTASGFVIPPHANYVGQVQGDRGSVAVVVHDSFAIAYFCNGGARLTANYALGHARGTVVVNGISYVFSIIAVHRPSGLFESIAVVRGATIKAGWIVLANGTQVGSLNPNVNAAKPVSQAAPKLNLSTLTAQDGNVTITATPIDAETGSGF